MPTQPLVERDDGSLFHLAVGDSMVLDVLGTDEELENCSARCGVACDCWWRGPARGAGST